jgi:acetyl-CoA acyltransferase
VTAANSNGTRVAVIAGCRTPFAKASTVYRDLSAVDLARICVRELMERAEAEPAWIDTVIMGQVIPSVRAPNLAREVVLGTAMPPSIPAHTVNRACASANEAIAEVASAILQGHAEVGIAGGAESLSDVPILHSRRMTKILMEASRARSLGERLAAFAKVRPRDLQPEVPAIAEPSTGLTMGQSAEKMAKENGISREAQDEIALMSHQRAAAATDAGRLAGEMSAVMVPPKYEPAVTEDNLIRKDTSLEALAKLPPVFDRKYGTVTAGNSSPLTDGAAAVLLMSEARARAEGYEPLAFIRSWAVSAVDPGGQLLMGPALAVPKALERAGVRLADIELIEMHEAFAAQVASNIQALESTTWAQEKLGRSTPVGVVDRAKLNVNGGSIAIGHPFGATGARLTTTLANEMTRRNAHLGLISVCAAGGIGFAMVLER